MIKMVYQFWFEEIKRLSGEVDLRFEPTDRRTLRCRASQRTRELKAAGNARRAVLAEYPGADQFSRY